MASFEDVSQPAITFYIGQHEPKRPYPVTDDVLRYAQDECLYDMLTAPITTDAFHSRVLSTLSSYLDTLVPASMVAGPAGDVPSIIVSSLTPADSYLAPSNHISQLILTTSPWIDLTSTDPLIADISRQILNLEVQYASFCGATNIMVSGPSIKTGQAGQEHLSRYARAIREALKLCPFIQLHLLLPMRGRNKVEPDDVGDLAQFARKDFRSHMMSGVSSDADIFDAWDVWNTTRTICKYSTRLSVALSILHDLPPRSLLSRWYSEPLRILHLPGEVFQENGRGDAILSQQHRQLILWYMRLRNPPWILLSQVGTLNGYHRTEYSSKSAHEILPSASANRIDWISSAQSNPDPTPAEASQSSMHAPQKQNGTVPHLQLLRNLQHNLPPKSTMETFGAGYQDFLQNPLQPLSDNLESITYEVFEKDPVKYDLYERAIGVALQDWQARRKPASGRNGRVVLAVVGAGRGPLVNRALQASANSGVEIDLWAVEKNTNAFVLLQRHNSEIWNQRVNLVQSDMRTWSGPYFYDKRQPLQQGSDAPENMVNIHIDILVSELLGSIGDNELSPECIDGVQRLLNPEHGISIPSSYAAHLTPIAAPKLHSDILTRNALGDPDASQIPYVVMLQAVDILSKTMQPKSRPSHIDRPEAAPLLGVSPSIQKAWEFFHPLRTPSRSLKQISPRVNDHNQRFAQLHFQCKDRGVCHGLGGYFEAVLFDPEEGHLSDLHSVSGDERCSSHKVPIAYTNGKVELSTNPLTMHDKSKNLISWFPIFFPLQVPLYFPDNSLLSVSIWRQTNGRLTWYEWMVEAFMLLEVTPDGTQKVERLSTTDIHSSFSNGCQL